MAFYPSKDDTLTSRNIMDSYVYAYHSVHKEKPRCVHLEGRWFLVNGIKRDRKWMLMEIERLRQDALSATLKNDDNSSRGSIFRTIRRLSRL